MNGRSRLGNARCAVQLVKAFPILWLGDLLLHSTQGPRESAWVLAKAGLRGWVIQGFSHLIGWLYLDWEYFIKFLKESMSPRKRQGGENKRRYRPRAAHWGYFQVLQPVADGSRSQRRFEDF